jgi:hypothetical protein
MRKNAEGEGEEGENFGTCAALCRTPSLHYHKNDRPTGQTTAPFPRAICRRFRGHKSLVRIGAPAAAAARLDLTLVPSNPTSRLQFPSA